MSLLTRYLTKNSLAIFVLLIIYLFNTAVLMASVDKQISSSQAHLCYDKIPYKDELDLELIRKNSVKKLFNLIRVTGFNPSLNPKDAGEYTISWTVELPASLIEEFPIPDFSQYTFLNVSKDIASNSYWFLQDLESKKIFMLKKAVDKIQKLETAEEEARRLRNIFSKANGFKTLEVDGVLYYKTPFVAQNEENIDSFVDQWISLNQEREFILADGRMIQSGVYDDESYYISLIYPSGIVANTKIISRNGSTLGVFAEDF